MNTHQRDFLRKTSSVAALAASGSVLKEDAEAAAIHTSDLTGVYGDLDFGALRDQFPVLKERVNGHALVYLGSAATTQRPRAIIDALSNFYLHDNANPAKNLHRLARRSASFYEKARETVAKFCTLCGKGAAKCNGKSWDDKVANFKVKRWNEWTPATTSSGSSRNSA